MAPALFTAGTHHLEDPEYGIDNAIVHDEDLVSLFRQQVFAQPDLIAVKDEELALTYSELEVWSDIFSKAVVEQLGAYKPEAVVAVCFSRSTLLVVSVLALAKAGLAYVTLDPDQPAPYLQKQIQESGALLVLTTSSLKVGQTLMQTRVAHVEQFIARAQIACKTSIPLSPANSKTSSARKDSLLTILFTSGTTGNPKGVMIEHDAMMNAVNADMCSLQPGERLAITANPAFDAWSYFVWYALCYGAAAVMYTSHLADLNAFVEFVRKERIDKAFLPTAAFARLVAEQSLLNSMCRVLRSLVVAGERLPPETVRAFALEGSQVELINAYGPSEAAVLATYHKVVVTTEVDTGETPIGQPIPNLKIHILNDSLEPVAPGEVGEICISGQSLARGYLHQEELTHQRFPFVAYLGTRIYRTGDLGVFEPLPNGPIVLQYKGRLDDQIKLRGQRIEPVQIEQVLLRSQVPGVVIGSQAAVVRSEGDRLIAYVVGRVCDSGSEDDEKLIRENWNAFTNDMENFSAVDSSLVGMDFVHWKSMYDGTPIPRAAMLQWLDDTLRTIPSKPGDSVLEIGCGTGMILFNVAKQSQDYIGLDFSQPSISFIQSHLSSQSLADKVTVFHGAADQVPDLLPPEKRFSLIIINSVVQYFGSRTYLENIITTCLDRIGGEGRIFLGDLRSYDLLPHHELTSTLQCNSGNVSTGYISQQLSRLVQSQSELLVNPTFFFELARKSNGRITHVEVLPKQMETLNELSQFRYQVILHVGPLPFTLLGVPTWYTYESGKVLENLLVSHRTVAVRGIPNKAVSMAQSALELLQSECSPPTSTELVAAATDSRWNSRSLSAADLCSMAERHGHAVDVSWGSQSDCTLSAVFTKEFKKENYRAGFDSLFDSQSDATNSPKLRPTCTTSQRELSIRLRDVCRAQLPSYMVPNEVILVKELPLTPNGKVNRKQLADPRRWRDYLASNDAPGDIVTARTKTQEQITQALSEVLELDSSNISMESDLFQLGLHSFSAVKLVARMSEFLGVAKFPIKLIYDYPTVAALATVLDGRDKDSLKTNDPLPSYGEDLERLYKVLPTTFPPSRSPKPKSTFFLTGATGFTGLFILSSLMLRRDFDVAKVICLVRGPSPEACRQRLFDNAAGRGIDTTSWPLQAGQLNLTLEVLQGDLGLPRFGLDDATWRRMTDEVDVVLANGAMVNLALDYASLRGANIGGCLTAIELCTALRLKALTFVSSTGIFDTLRYKARAEASVPILESDDLEDARTGLHIGYLQSKWVAERLVMRMADLGLPCNIVRPCHISGNAISGVVCNDDYFWRYTLGFVELGLFPEKRTSIYWVTVNYAAAVCVAAALAALDTSSRGLKHVAYNAVPSRPTKWSQYFDMLQSFGYTLRLVPVDSFLEHLASNDAILSKDVVEFREYYCTDISDEDQLPECDDANARTLLEKYHPKILDERPLQQDLDITTIGTCIAYMVAIGFMPPPSMMSQHKLPDLRLDARHHLMIPRRGFVTERKSSTQVLSLPSSRSSRGTEQKKNMSSSGISLKALLRMLYISLTRVYSYWSSWFGYWRGHAQLES